jgi:hypothetical protein
MTLVEALRQRKAANPAHVRMTVSLPADLVAWVRAVAAEANVPVSQVVAFAIEEDMKSHRLAATEGEGA